MHGLQWPIHSTRCIGCHTLRPFLPYALTLRATINPCGTTERKKAAKAAKKAAKKERKAIAAAGGAAAEALIAADAAQSKEASELKARYIGKPREHAGVNSCTVRAFETTENTVYNRG